MDQKDYFLDFKSKHNYLIVIATGTRTYATVIAITREIFDMALVKNKSKMVVDVRKLKGHLGALDIYNLVKEMFYDLRGKGVDQTAIVDTPKNPQRDRLLETIARNRGFNFRIFSNLKDAQKWIER